MTYRSDLDALSARHDALASEVAEKQRELDEAGRELERAKERAWTPALPYLRVATPCSAEWNEMTGDERVRACSHCDQNVYNLSHMTRAEAEALIYEKRGKLCMRYYQRSDGTIIMKDCEVGLAQKRKRRVVAAGALAMLAGGGAGAYALTRPPEQLSPLKVAIPEITVTPPPAPTVVPERPVEVMQGVPPPPEQWLPPTKPVKRHHRR